MTQMQNGMLRLLGMTAVSVGLLIAQGPRMGRGLGNQQAGPGANAENRVARLAVFLDLTETQKAAALKIFQAACGEAEQRQSQSAELRERWQAAIKNGDGTQIDSLSREWADMMAASRAIAAKAQTEFRRLLTPEQLAKLDALNGAGMGMMGNRGGGRGRGGMNCGAQMQPQP